MTPAPIQSADLSGIIERLQNATGPDREIDAQIWLATTPGATRNSLEVKSTKNLWSPYTIDETRDETGRLVVVPAVTASVDAAIALAERVLPGWFWRLGSTPLFPKGWAFVSRTDANNALPGDEHASADGKAATPAIALLIAVLKAARALQSKGEA